MCAPLCACGRSGWQENTNACLDCLLSMDTLRGVGNPSRIPLKPDVTQITQLVTWQRCTQPNSVCPILLILQGYHAHKHRNNTSNNKSSRQQ